jgi:hypothetical protein
MCVMEEHISSEVRFPMSKNLGQVSHPALPLVTQHYRVNGGTFKGKIFCTEIAAENALHSSQEVETVLE